MQHMRNIALVFLLFWMGGVRLLFGQDAYMELAMRFSRAQVYHEPLVLPDGDHSRLVISFRIPNSELVFLRNPRSTAGQNFVAQPNVVIQLYRNGRRIDEQVWRQAHYATSFEATQNQLLDVEGWVPFDVVPGTYAYVLRLDGRQTEEARVMPPRAVAVPAFSERALGVPLLVQDMATIDDGIAATLANLGGDVPYGEVAQIVFPVRLPKAGHHEAAKLQYTLRRLGDETAYQLAQVQRRQEQAWRLIRQEGQMPVVPASLEPARPAVGRGVEAGRGTLREDAFQPVGRPELSDGRIYWPTKPTRETGDALFLVVVPIDGRQLQDGVYVLQVTLSAEGQQVTSALQFRMHWRGMPLSLYSAEAAIRNLIFITDRKTVKEMLKGKPTAQQAQVRAFWAERDPTPETTYNELMTEYYQRVDEAATRFRTGSMPGPDGLRTDQARIFVVYGPPEAVDRSFPSAGGVREVWQYAGGRQFVFWAPTSLEALDLQAEDRR